MLRSIPEVATISFRQITFWGGFDYIADGWYLRRGPATCHRVFNWDKGFEYVSHRPPTVHDKIGRASCRERVCQYVWFSLVAVSLQNKPANTPIDKAQSNT